MNESIVEEVRKFVEEECRKPSNKYTYEVYDFHIVQVVKYAKEIAKKLNADLEIVELASLLHDIGLVCFGRENHHITRAEIAEEKLKELNYPEEKIEIVKKCILNHRGSVNNQKSSVEEQIIADADGMTMFDRIEGVFLAAFVYEKLGQIEARKSARQKLINSYNKLSEDAKKIVQNKFEAAMLLLS